MRALVVGAGSLGTCYAALLADAGAEISILVRRESRDAYGDGLRVSGLVERRAPVRVVTSGDELEAVDYLILATKARDTSAALEAVGGLAVGGALSLQNGIDKNARLAERFGREAVLGAACTVGGSLVERGHARLTLNQGTWVGEGEGGVSERVVKLVVALRAAGFPAWSVADVMAVEWFKLGMLIPGWLVTALSRRTYAEMCLHPELRGLWLKILRECFSVPQMLGVKISTPPGSPWRIAEWLEGADEVALEGLREIGEGQRAAGQEVRTSMMQDVLGGRRTEGEEVIGPLIRRAGELGIELPATEAAYRLVRGLEDGFAS